MGKDGARAQWHIYHVPALIRHPEGKLAGQTSDYFVLHARRAAHVALVHGRAGAGDDGQGEDLSVLFEAASRRPARTTSCYDNYLLCGDGDWFLLSDSEGGMQAPVRQAQRPRQMIAEHPRDRRPVLEGARGRGGRDSAAVRVIGARGGSG